MPSLRQVSSTPKPASAWRKAKTIRDQAALLANEAIAVELMGAKLPFLHHRHDVPDPLKLKTLARTLSDLGFPAR